MTNFLINLPYHKRWWLPDGLHQYNSVIFGDIERITIIRARDGQMILSHSLNILKPDWDDLSHTAQELANKRFPRPGPSQV